MAAITALCDQKIAANIIRFANAILLPLFQLVALQRCQDSSGDGLDNGRQTALLPSCHSNFDQNRGPMSNVATALKNV